MAALVGALASPAMLAGAPALAHGSALTYYGASGSFGTVGSRFAAGSPVATNAVPGWGFAAGQAAYFTAVAPDGSVLIANEPQTDNQFLPTADHMAVSVFSPAANRFENVVVPTTAGKTRTARDGVEAVGGGDISDLAMIPSETGARLAFLSTAPYHNWQLSQDGEYPTLGYLSNVDGRWAHDPARSRSASQLAAMPGDARPCRMNVNSRWEASADCHAVTEMATLPRSRQLAVTQYVPASGSSRSSGDILVMDDTGRASASYEYPDIELADGTRVGVYPREINADPTSPDGRERFVVIFDAVVGAGTPEQHLVPFAAQEFSFNAAAKSITPESLPVLSGETDGGRPLGFETGQYDARGRLWLAQGVNGTFQGGPLAVYEPRPDGGVLTGPGCAAPANWSGSGWATACRPSASIVTASPLGIVRSLTAHDDRGVLAATMSGYLLPVSSNGGSYVSRSVVDLGLGELVDRPNAWVGPRKGSVDPVSGDLWLPIQQLRTTASCPRHPCTPVKLHQWLTRVDAGRLLSAETVSQPLVAPSPADAPAASPADAPAASPADAPTPETPAVAMGGALRSTSGTAATMPSRSSVRSVGMPRIRFTARLATATLLSGRAVVRVTCPSACAVKAELRTSGKGRHLLGRGAAREGSRGLQLGLRAPRSARARLPTSRRATAAVLVVWLTDTRGATRRLTSATQILRATER